MRYPVYTKLAFIIRCLRFIRAIRYAVSFSFFWRNTSSTISEARTHIHSSRRIKSPMDL